MVNRITILLYLAISTLTSCSPGIGIEKEQLMHGDDPFDFDDYEDFDPFDPTQGDIRGAFDNPGRFSKADHIIHQDPLQLRARGAEKAPMGKVVFPIEPRQGPWSGNNQLGITQAFAPDVNNRQTILKLDEWGMPQVWTVMLGIRDNSDSINPGILKVQAVVDVGSGGTQQIITVDWKQGAVFSATMNSINVIAEYETSSGTDDVDIDLTVTLARGTHSGLTGPTVTRNLLVTTPFTLLEIPKFATHVTLLRPEFTSPDIYVVDAFYSFYGIAGTADPQGTVEGPNVLSFGSIGFPIPNGAKYMLATGADQQSAIAVFTLGGL